MAPTRRFSVSPTDGALALVLAGWAIAESGSEPAIGIPAALLMTVPLAWRRVAPLPVSLLVASGFALEGAQAEPPESLATLIAFMVAAYSVAAACERLRLALGLFGLAAGAIAETALVDDGDYLFILVVLGAAAAAGRALGVRGRQAEREREAQAALAVAAERERIARELHDSVAHAVSLMVVQAGAAETAVGADPRATAALERIRATGQEAVADLGRMVGLLRSDPAASPPVPGVSDPERLVAPFREAGLPVDLIVAGTPRPLPTGLDSAVFRIAQEALTNALKHGDRRASLTISYEPGAVRLNVRNPLCDARPDHPNGTGHGLAGMRERVRLFGGTLRAAPSTKGDEFEVDAWLPTSDP